MELSEAGPAFAAIKTLVIDRTGHEYYADKDGQLWEHVARRIAACGDDDAAAYLRRLSDPGSVEWSALESAITINETFFFRFADQFEALRTEILPALIAKRRSERQLRIWSVGCSTGAEAHSIAILLRDQLGDELPAWRIQLIGTDIDEAALQAARAADYSSWTLRTLGEAERQRLFDRRGDRYRLRDRYRGIARFERHNILSLIDGSAPLQFVAFDLILCRNVLIYFRQDQATAIVGALAGRLVPDGLLLLGHAEPNPGFDTVARGESVAGVLAYRRLDSVQPPVAIELTAAAEPVRPPPVPAPSPKARPVRQAPMAVPTPPPVPTAMDGLDAVRRALSIGDPVAAVACAEQAVASTPNDPVAHYLLALGAAAIEQPDRVERSFRAALYLDPGFAMAHYLLGRHLLAAGRSSDGRRSLANALRIVQRLPDATELPEGDGMTADAMARAARATIGPAA